MKRFPVMFVAVVCCLVLSALVGCGVQKEKSEEPKMKTFENKNLSVDYPEDWNAGEHGGNESDIVSISNNAIGELENRAIVEVMIRKNYKLPDLSSNPGAIRANEKIGGIDFVTFTESKEADKSETKICYTERNGDTIAILAVYTENNKEMVEKIIGTMKFKF